MTLEKKPFENILGKGENAGNQHFFLFPTMFPTLSKTNFNFSAIFVVSKCFQFGIAQNFVVWERIKATKYWTGQNSKHLQLKH